MNLFQSVLKKVADIQLKYKPILAVFFIIFTLVMIVGATKIQFRGDINEEMPRQLPVFQLSDRISDKFEGQDVLFVLLELDNDLESQNVPKDIRDPDIMEYVITLHEALGKETAIDEVVSIAPLIQQLQNRYGSDIPQEAINDAIDSNPALSGIISDDYTKTMVLVYADVGASQNKIIDLEDLINNELEALSTPAGVNARVSGTPSIISTILDLLKQDAIFTIVLASIIILILLFIIERSITRGLLIFIPILLGLTWTLGTMGFADIQISVATAGLGAMILGLGTEYGVFMLTRYTEERSKGKTQAEAVKTAVPSVGASVMGSGTTTIVGFLALTLSIMPMLQNLGKSLALGILYCIIASVIVEPLLIMEEEKLHHKFTQRRYKKALEQKRRLDSNGGAR